MRTIRACLVIITVIVIGAAVWGISIQLQASRKAHEADLDERRRTLNAKSSQEYQSWAESAVDLMLTKKRLHPATTRVMQPDEPALDEETNREIHRALAGLNSATEKLSFGNENDVEKCDEGIVMYGFLASAASGRNRLSSFTGPSEKKRKMLTESLASSLKILRTEVNAGSFDKWPEMNKLAREELEQAESAP
jgi:hypothetical protein